jgi:phosphate transport system substrate-binding protein
MEPTMPKLLASSLLLATFASCPAHAQEVVQKETLHASLDRALPPYRPVPYLAGTLESFGSDTMDDLMQPWADAFHAIYPGVTINVHSKASMSIPAALTSGAAQLAPLSREFNPAETEAFRAKYGFTPTETRVALGSYRTPTRTVALTFYVNEANPIARLNFAQLDAMWCTTRKRGLPMDVITWGQLGLTGEWASRPIHLVGVLPPDGVPNFISRVICKGGPFREGILTEKNAGTNSVLTRIVQDVAKDPDAIGYAGFHNQLPGTRHVLIAEEAGGPYLEGTFDEVRTAHYPLTRFVNIYTAQASGKSSDQLVSEFLRFVLSHDGQVIVEQEGIFMPLPAKIAEVERSRTR